MAREAQTVVVPRSQVSVKTVLTVVCTVLGVLALAWLVVHAKVALSLLIAAAFVAAALNHAVDAMEKRGLNRKVGIAAVMLGLLAVIAGIFLLLIPPAVRQGKALASSAPELIQKVKAEPIYQRVNERVNIDQKLEHLKQEAPKHLAEGTEPVVKVLSGAVAVLAGVVTLIFLTLFMLLFGGRLVRAALNEALPDHRVRYQRVVSKIYRAVGGYLSGLALICGVNATLSTIMLAILRVPFFLPLGILSGLSSLVPLAGNTIVGVFITAIVAITGGVWKGVAMACFFIVYQQFENHLLGPMVYRRTVDVNPLVTLGSVLIFAEIAGVPGAIVAVPAVAAVQVIIKELLAMRRERLALPTTGPAGRVGVGAGPEGPTRVEHVDAPH